MEVDTLVDKDGKESDSRRNLRLNENPADCYPMVLHGKFKIMSNIEHILKYFMNSFPYMKQLLFDNI